MHELGNSIVVVLTAIVGVAILSVLVSKNANTAGVIQAGASGFGNDLAVAISPVTGAQTPINLSYPGGGGLLGSLSGLTANPYGMPFGQG